MKVFVASPVRNRAWILPEFLEALETCLLNTEAESEMYFLVNDSVDATETILASFKERSSVPVTIENVKNPIKSGHIRGQYNFINLARLRNKMLDKFIESEADFMFSIDSDIIVEQDTLSRLLSDNLDVVSALISNWEHFKPFESPAHNFHVTLWDDKGKPYQGHPLPHRIPRNEVIDVVMIGAIFVISRKAVMSGARYAYHVNGEDTAFCNSLKSKGFKMYVDTDVICDHRMISESDKYI